MKLLAELDPRVKFLCLLVYFIAAFHAQSALSLGVCLALAVACACSVRLGTRGFFGVLRPLAPILVITVVMQVLYQQQGSVLVQFGGVAVTQEALVASARMLVCLLSVMVMSVAFMRCTPVEDLTFAFGWLLAPLRKLGVRTEALMFSLGVSFRFIPVLVDEFRQLKRAQESRLGAFDGTVRQKLAAYARLFAPLVRSSFRRADMLAEASVTRAFGCGIAPTRMREHTLHARDVLAVLAMSAVIVATFVLDLSKCLPL